MEINAIVNALGICVVVCPVALVAVLGLTSLIGWPLSEQSIVRFIHVTGLTGFAASLSMLAIMLATDHRIEVITVGNLVNIPNEHFHFHVIFLRLALQERHCRLHLFFGELIFLPS